MSRYKSKNDPIVVISHLLALAGDAGVIPSAPWAKWLAVGATGIRAKREIQTYKLVLTDYIMSDYQLRSSLADIARRILLLIVRETPKGAAARIAETIRQSDETAVVALFLALAYSHAQESAIILPAFHEVLKASMVMAFTNFARERGV